MKKSWLQTLRKWLQPGIRIKRWLILLAFGMLILGVGLAQAFVILFGGQNKTPVVLHYIALEFLPPLWRVLVAGTVGVCAILIAVYELNTSILQPIVSQYNMPWVDIVMQHNMLQRGLRVVVIGGGTGLPSVLRGIKQYTTHITPLFTITK